MREDGGVYPPDRGQSHLDSWFSCSSWSAWGWSAFPRPELSGEEWTDSLASIRPAGVTVSGPFDSGVDRLWSASFLLVRSLIAKGLNFGEKQTQSRSLSDAAITHQSRIAPGDNGV